MKQLNIYFGAQKDSCFGWGSLADIIKCTVPDDFDPDALISSKWTTIKLANGIKRINTANILWFDLLDEVEQPQEVKSAVKKNNEVEKSIGQQKLFDTVESVFSTSLISK